MESEFLGMKSMSPNATALRSLADLSAEELAAFEAAGIGIMRRPADVVELLRKRM